MSDKKKILIISDALEGIKIPTDSGLALAQGALEHGHEVYWATDSQISLFNSKAYVSHMARILYASVKGVSSEVVAATEPLSQFHYAFIRRDPPFDESYVNLCWALLGEKKTKIINSPDRLLTNHEKTIHLFAIGDGVIPESAAIPTCVSRSPEFIRDFCKKHQSAGGFIVKPWLGFGGNGIFHVQTEEEVLHICTQKSLQIVQPFVEDIYTLGDRRVLIANGEVIGDFVRFPKAGGIASNLAQGGNAKLVPMTSYQKSMMDKLGQYLKNKGILFAGVDLIGDKIGEVNITAPTGIRTLEELTQQPFCRDIFGQIIS